MWALKKSYFALRTCFNSSAASTIFALSSGQGKCGVAVIRISGPKASEAIFKMTTCAQLPKPRMAVLQHIIDPETSEELDKGLILWFPGPKSFTGEDSCEFQIHGGIAVIASILSGLSKIPGFQPAQPGDFTKRAFYNGKFDLTEVEGLGDLIHAETELQRKQALYQMEGNLSNLYKKWQEALKKNLAHVEAYIDFSEDDNLEDGILDEVRKNLVKLKKEICNHLKDGRKGERLRDGIKTTLIGEPNAGKSSLLNAISGKPEAIVTPVPGTTRDVIKIHLNLNGFPIILADTAGLRTESSDLVEQEGISRAYSTLEKSDLVLLILDSEKFIKSGNDITTFLKDHLQNLNINTTPENILNSVHVENMPKYILVLNKIDLLTDPQRSLMLKLSNYKNIYYISCKTEEGIEALLEDVTRALQQLCGDPSRESPTITQSRHRHHLNKCFHYLTEYFEVEDVTVQAQKLRLSLRHLGKIIGTVTNDEILEVIFRDFCIGK